MKTWRLIIPTIALVVGMALPSATSYAAIPIPGTPTNVMAWAGDQSVRVTWEIPVTAAAYVVSQNQITVYQDGLLARTVQFAAPSDEKVVTGLNNYHSYTFTVQVKQKTGGNAAEESAWSAPSAVSNPVRSITTRSLSSWTPCRCGPTLNCTPRASGCRDCWPAASNGRGAIGEHGRHGE